MSKGSGKAVNLRDKLDGNELDLSLSDLTEVPVKDLACLPKATVLDVSCNNLRVLPSEFCSLTHLVKLDLSKNQLVQLPPEFGRLVNLQHLDLYNNKLVVLPVSFAQLKNLKWLDLKDNPLEPTLAKVAGDCLDEKQCRACASHVLQHMRVLQSDMDREKQRRLQAEREQEKKREAEQRAKEARERELRKKEKAEEKERKRREYDAQRAARASQEQLDANQKAEAEPAQQQPCAVSSAPKVQTSWLPFILKLFLLLLLAAAAMVAVCQLTELRRDEACVPINSLYADLVSALKRQEVVSRILQKLSSQQP